MKMRGAAVAAILASTGLALPAAAQPGEIAISIEGAPAMVHDAIVDGAWRYCRQEMAGKYRDRAALLACVRATVDSAVASAARADLTAHHYAMGARARYQARG